MRGTERLAGCAALIALVLAGCAGAGPPPIRTGMPCEACGMEIRDLRFACERPSDRGWRRYDAIECLIRDTPAPAAGSAWLTDYDTALLHEASAVWVVRGSFPSPMGGGFAAFASRGAADSVAAITSGSVARLASFLGGAAEAR